MKAERTARQKGGTLILFALCLVVLFAFAGLVLDLGATYVGKTELQNAADASALAGARKLNGTRAGVAAALQAAKDMALLNKYHFGKDAVTVTDNDVWVGSCPDDSCFTTLAANVSSDAMASGKYFLKVDTRSRNFDTTFMQVANISNTSARGVAVAGRYYIPITPIGICALDTAKCPPNSGECGFERGLGYNVNAINAAIAPSGMGPGSQLWIDPVATNSSECSGNVNDNRPFVCEGKTNVAAQIGGTVYTNTGVSNALLASLDSRFGDYDSQGKCDPSTAPPDTNIMGYLGGDPGSNPDKKLLQDGDVMDDWRYGTTLPPADQAAPVTSGSGVKPVTVDNTKGVRWSAVRPANPGTQVNSNYPTGTGATPYRSTSGKYFEAPSKPGQADRRILNMVVVDCTTAGGSCRPATVKMVGRFFMTRKSNVSSDPNVYVEYYDFVDPSLLASQEVKLFQ